MKLKQSMPNFQQKIFSISGWLRKRQLWHKESNLQTTVSLQTLGLAFQTHNKGYNKCSLFYNNDNTNRKMISTKQNKMTESQDVVTSFLFLKGLKRTPASSLPPGAEYLSETASCSTLQHALQSEPWHTCRVTVTELWLDNLCLEISLFLKKA